MCTFTNVELSALKSCLSTSSILDIVFEEHSILNSFFIIQDAHREGFLPRHQVSTIHRLVPFVLPRVAPLESVDEMLQ